MKNKTQILATDLVASFISTNFIKNEILGNYGHDFCKSLQGLDTNIVNGLYIATDLILKQYLGKVNELLNWLNQEELTPPVFTCFTKDVNVCWNLYYWLKLVK